MSHQTLLYPVLYKMEMKRVQKLDDDHGRKRKDPGIETECKVVYGHRASRNLGQLATYDQTFPPLENAQGINKRKFLSECLPLKGLLPDYGDLQKTQRTLSHWHPLQHLLRSSRKDVKVNSLAYFYHRRISF